MKKTTLALLITLFTATTASSAWADGPQGGPDQRWQQSHGHDDHRGPQPGHDDHRAPQRGHDEHHDSGRDHFAWQGHDFRRGHSVPQAYRGDHYRVNDWRARGLHEPPAGDHWAYINGNYVLIAAATGIITSIILNSAH